MTHLIVDLDCSNFGLDMSIFTRRALRVAEPQVWHSVATQVSRCRPYTEDGGSWKDSAIQSEHNSLSKYNIVLSAWRPDQRCCETLSGPKSFDYLPRHSIVTPLALHSHLEYQTLLHHRVWRVYIVQTTTWEQPKQTLNAKNARYQLYPTCASRGCWWELNRVLPCKCLYVAQIIYEPDWYSVIWYLVGFLTASFALWLYWNFMGCYWVYKRRAALLEHYKKFPEKLHEKKRKNRPEV